MHSSSTTTNATATGVTIDEQRQASNWPSLSSVLSPLLVISKIHRERSELSRLLKSFFFLDQFALSRAFSSASLTS